MTPLPRPAIYWARCKPTPHKRSRSVHDHLFRDDQQRAACGPSLIPDLRRSPKGHRGLRGGPPPTNACRRCAHAWALGWPYDMRPETTTP